MSDEETGLTAGESQNVEEVEEPTLTLSQAKKVVEEILSTGEIQHRAPYATIPVVHRALERATEEPAEVGEEPTEDDAMVEADGEEEDPGLQEAGQVAGEGVNPTDSPSGESGAQAGQEAGSGRKRHR